jgi:hypothetical protein
LPKIDIYGWGGVNTTKNPVQLEHGELTKAQNAIRDPAGDHGSLRKRPGLTKINSVALTGSVFGFVNVPLNLITLRQFFVGIDQGDTAAYQWVTSSNAFGATATATTPAAVPTASTEEYFGSPHWTNHIGSRGTQTETLFYYPGTFTRGSAMPIRVYDGTTDKELFKIPTKNDPGVSATAAQITASEGAIRSMIVEGTKIYMVVHDFHNTGATFDNISYVVQYDIETQQLQQIGEAASGYIASDIGDGGVGFTGALALHQGLLYAGIGSLDGVNSTAAGIYFIRPNIDTTWTQELDQSGGTNGEVTLCLKTYKGLLYAGCTDYDATGARILVRSVTGSWSASTTIGGATTDNMVPTLTVFGDNLYATSLDTNGGAGAGTNVSRIHKFDGTTWSVVKTLETAATPVIGVATVVHNGVLYVLCKDTTRAGQVSSSSDGSSWADQTSNLTTGVTSVFGVLAT